MSVLPPKSSGISHQSSIAVSLWLAVQLLAVVVCGFRIPFAAGLPRALETTLPDVLIFIQVTFSALLWPVLMCSPRSAGVTIGSAWPLLLLAAFLGIYPLPQCGLAGLYVTVWMLSLFLLGPLARNPRSGLMLVTMTGAVSLAGPLLWYLGAEFGRTMKYAAWLGPAMGALGQLKSGQMVIVPWISLSCILVIAAAANLFSLRAAIVTY